VAQEPNNDNDFTISITGLATYLVIIGGLVSAWVSLNSSQVETDTKLSAFETYYQKSFDAYTADNKEDKEELKEILVEQQKTTRTVVKQLDRLEQRFELVYRTIKKR